MQNSLISRKIKIVYILIFVLASLLVLSSIRWQVIEAAKFSKLAEGRIEDTTIPSIRGTIYAADGSTLAYSEPRYDLYVYAPDLQFAETTKKQTRDEFVAKIAPLIDNTAESLAKTISTNIDQGLSWFKIASAISVEQKVKIEAFRKDADKSLSRDLQSSLEGYSLQYTSKRFYPEGQLASQILGLTKLTDDGKTIGLGGLEGEWDGYLEPQAGYVTGELDAKGNAVGLASELTIEAKRGSNVYTTINKQIQAVVEERLKWGVDYYQAKSGTTIVMEPKTGNIIAIANYPTYDPNVRDSTDPDVYGNKALTDPYEIGSIGKVFTMSAALDTHTVTPDDVVIQGHNGCEKVSDDLEPVCTYDKQPQPPMAIKDAFAKSDNIYFLHLGGLMSKETFYDYLVKYGVGIPSGIDATGESVGYITPFEKWNVTDVSAYSYGHGYSMSAIEAITAVGALANNGVRMQPHLVQKLEESDGTIINYKPTAVEEVVSPDTVAQMYSMMHTVYENNIFPWEYQYDDLRGYNIAMKSGTALIADPLTGTYTSDINSTYVGYDASPDRKFIMLTRLEKPQDGTLSSQNARLVWLETFERIKDYLGVTSN